MSNIPLAERNLLNAADEHRKKADAYTQLAHQLSAIELREEPAPIREIANALRVLGLCVVHERVLASALDCLDPQDEFMHPRDLEDNTVASAKALRAILHPERAEKPNHELPL